ncbi:MAG: hypothetical protein ABSH20_25715 [Tepidisphaeraceae bacterium]|jgi:hypothetical protein
MRHLLMFVSLLASIPGLAAENLLFNGDFEMPSSASPPPGWVMWGANQWKVPANYTRDTTNAHGGQACFRINHPADSRGYVVSSPDHAITVQPNVAYTLAFWARASRNAQATAGFDTYQSLKPLAGYSSPATFHFDVGSEWKQYTFRIEEGLDFFATAGRHLLLRLHATRDNAADVTLWIDDMVLTQAARPESAVRLFDENVLPHDPVHHVLKSADRWEIWVDAAKTIRPAQRLATGISFHRVAGWTGFPFDKAGNYTLMPQLEQAITDLKLPMTRFYGVGHESFSVEDSIDKMASFCTKVGIPLENIVLELDEQSANRKLAPADWARAVRHCQTRKYPFRYWEVGNEVYSQMFIQPKPMGQAFKTPDDYVSHVQVVSAAIKAVAPEAQIGLSIEPRNLKWGNYVLRRSAGAYDFAVPHLYSFGSIEKRRFETTALSENFTRIEMASRLNALIKAYNPSRDVYIYDTEWGSLSSGATGNPPESVNRNANIFGTMHRAVRLIYYVREATLRGASSWEMFTNPRDPGCGILSGQAPDKRFLIYWLYYYFNRHVGSQVVQMEGTSPWYTPPADEETNPQAEVRGGPLAPALVTLSQDARTLYVVVANGSWDQILPCTMKLSHFTAKSAKCVVLSQPDADSPALVDKREDAMSNMDVRVNGDTVTFTLPGHSIGFITVE